jgi:hypothetical protein
VGVQADAAVLDVVDVATEVFDLRARSRSQRCLSERAHLVGIVIRRGNFDGGGQIEDDWVLLCAIAPLEPDLLYPVADLDGKGALGLGKGFGRVLVLPLGAVAACDALVDELADDAGMPRGEVDGLLFRVVEDDFAEAGRGSVVLCGGSARR